MPVLGGYPCFLLSVGLESAGKRFPALFAYGWSPAVRHIGGIVLDEISLAERLVRRRPRIGQKIVAARAMEEVLID